MFQNIPLELQKLNQWVCWRYEDIGSSKATKVPYDPKAPYCAIHADVNKPHTWADFNAAVNSCEIMNYDGIGFVFSDSDPYTFIDLDDPSKLVSGQPNPNYNVDLERQIKIFKEFDSYAEQSPSGTGLHIIVKGKVPVGRRRSFIEIYSSQRYATFTGKVYHNKPIEQRQDVLMQLWEQMGVTPTTSTFTGNDKELMTDEQIINQALNAINGDKFKSLLEGQWHSLYPSQSEADFAFIDIVAFYTQNKKQIERIFYASLLGQREKAKRTGYVGWMISRSFDRMLPPIDFDGFKNALDTKMAQIAAGPQLALPMEMPSETATKSTIPIPPGLLGEIAQFIYQASARPIPELALAAAIGLMAGVTGRAYNISGTGLNQYVILVANTGSGKEGISSGIDKIMNAIKQQVPTSPKFRGPAEIASGQALIKYLNKKSNCFVSILGEFGMRLSELSNPLAQNAEQKLKRVLMDLYNKSGFGQTFQGMSYADVAENIDVTNNPAVSLIGETTPETFYNTLNEDMIASGLLPRFIIIEYVGRVPYLNQGHQFIQPPFALVQQFATLTANCETIMHANKVINIEYSPEADELQRKFEKMCTDHLNSATTEVRRQLWNRAHIKSIRLAGLVAVGVNMAKPVITADYLMWAMDIIQSDIKALSAKFESGSIGSHSSENKQIEEVRKLIRKYFAEGLEGAKKYSVSELIYQARVIPQSYLSKRLMSIVAFRNDRQGATVAMHRTIKTMLDTDQIREVPRHDMANRFGSTQRAFIVSDLTMLG